MQILDGFILYFRFKTLTNRKKMLYNKCKFTQEEYNYEAGIRLFRLYGIRRQRNEKYAFRCFLLRLGFIGAEYKSERKILLENFTGSAAFKSGLKKGKEGE